MGMVMGDGDKDEVEMEMGIEMVFGLVWFEFSASSN